MNSFTSRFNQAFKNTGFSQSELGRRAKLPRATIHDYLIGKYIPKRDKLERLAKALNVDPDWLAGANVSKDGTQKVELSTADNLYLDNKPVTSDEQSSIVTYLRGYRAAKNSQ